MHSLYWPGYFWLPVLLAPARSTAFLASAPVTAGKQYNVWYPARVQSLLPVIFNHGHLPSFISYYTAWQHTFYGLCRIIGLQKILQCQYNRRICFLLAGILPAIYCLRNITAVKNKYMVCVCDNSGHSFTSIDNSKLEKNPVGYIAQFVYYLM